MTRVLATVKPGASYAEDLAKLSTLTELGVHAIRVNLGRRSLDDNRRVLRAVADVPGDRPEIFADLPGVKGRLGDIAPSPYPIRPGVTVELTDDPGRAGIALRMPAGVRPPAAGDELVLDDGKVRLRVEHTDGGVLRCRVLVGTGIPRHAGVVISASDGPVGELTDRDSALAAAIGPEVDYLCPSFVSGPAMLAGLSDPAVRPRRGVIAKIETPRGVAALRSILPACAGVMLARGDLSAFMTDDEMRRTAASMVEVARDLGGVVVFASNFFRGLSTAPYRLTEHERRTLDWVGELMPDFLMLNETGFSPRWAEVAATAAGLCRGWDETRAPGAARS
jgi:pyruvate kinase